MSQVFKAILATLAVSGTLGAVQLASGHDLIGRQQLAATDEPAGVINRGAKADRVALKAAQTPTETLTIRTVDLPDTSVVVRVPVAQMPSARAPKEEVRNRPEPSRPATTKRAIACEPPVSVLTEVAKLLEPGRCVT
ncbi:hypothetical protein [Bradyrhizobium roseum]|uniref:hypothetical protein n=1 Tax=Bradyrhizobium roseum TaxID=3056648 RepID=UPI00260A25F6|nr:hypothetical protein [Bradyrhizobium roseus]WKA29539.1 hypothetical protein QUH67_04945 [Bradyrhizobium roseus]